MRDKQETAQGGRIKNGGDDRTRTGDLLRDRQPFQMLVPRAADLECMSVYAVKQTWKF